MNEKLKESYVSRSVYQKLAEEKKKLDRDIYILCHEKYTLSVERMHVKMTWRDKFTKDEEFWNAIREAILEKKQSDT